MKIVITGGAGFLGRRLAERIATAGRLTGPSGAAEPVDEIVLFDVAPPPERPAGLDARIRFVAGDVADRERVAALIDRDDVGVFHLASVVSGSAEQDFDLALRINLDGGLAVLDACRARGGRPRLVFASSLAVFGGAAMAGTVGDGAKQTPGTTYGVTKAIGELLVNDYTRKGFLDGRTARLPTVIIRPGRPNKAASSFVSGIFREPLGGEPCRVPVGAGLAMPVLGYRSAIEGLVRLYEADGAALGEDRAVGFPSLSVTVGEMIEALHRVAHDRTLGEITIEPDPAIEAIVATWPRAMTSARADSLGLPVDQSLDAIIRAYMEDYLEG